MNLADLIFALLENQPQGLTASNRTFSLGRNDTQSLHKK